MADNPSTSSEQRLKPWRDVITPHPDVASGRYVQAEFMADLAQVVAGAAEPEYQDPAEFFRRTYMTPGIVSLLGNALERLAGRGGEPVVELKTAFGGGKTHTMLALYHLVSGSDRLKAIDEIRNLLQEHGLDQSPVRASTAVLVGTALNPSQGRPRDGLGGGEVRTLWGELAYQLGGVPGYTMVAEADASGVAPGSDTLADLFQRFSPCVVLLDEFVAFARNIRGAGRRLPAGTFESNMTFVQSLTEAVKRVPKAVLVASLPESAVEIGGPAGQEALTRIENTFRRVGAISMPVAATEAFEIVKRRLFGQVLDPASVDATCAAFAWLYRENQNDFPVECRELEYERRLRASYPIHPEVFDRLYDDWSVLEHFQRTRGVLRLMATVIHQLWQSGDTSALIMPGSLPLYAPRVRDELLHYLSDQWNAVLDEVDGDQSEAALVDNENPRFGQIHAARRLTRATFMGSPYKATRGIEDVRIRLGVVQPQESISTYNDALGRLQQRLQFLYASGQGRFWFDVQPNLTRTVADRASRISDDEVFYHLEERLRQTGLRKEEFAGVHVCPSKTEEVPDEPAVRLVVLSPRQPHKRNAQETAALAQAAQTLEQRGSAPRRYRNMLVYAAADEDAVQYLTEETRRYLAWKSIEKDSSVLNLDRAQERQVKESVEQGEKTIAVQLDTAYQWAIVPKQEGTNLVEWEAILSRGTDLGSTGNLVQRAAYRLQSQELLIVNWSPIHLKRELDQYLWKDGRSHISVKQLWEYFATYVYLPRLRDKDVLLTTIRSGVFTKDFFGYATGTTDDGGYVGLTFGSAPPGVYYDDTGVVIRPEVAAQHLQTTERGAATVDVAGAASPTLGGTPGVVPPSTAIKDASAVAKRFYGTVHLNPLRISSEAGTIGQEIVQHLESLLGANVEVTLEISAESPNGFPDNVVRTVTENARTLKFDNFGFEGE